MDNAGTRLKRRAVARAALALPALGVARAAAAAVPFATGQAPGFYRRNLGAYQVTIVNDGGSRIPAAALETFVRNAPAAEVRAALARRFMPTDHLDLTYNPVLLNIGRQLILFDTGTGGHLGPTAGMMEANLRAAGVEPAAVDLVVITHFHPDHISGVIDSAGKARFATAGIIVPEAEWAFWTGERAPERAREMVRSRFAPYPPDRIRRIASTAEVAPGVRAMPTFGHTPGHTSYLVSSGEAALLVLGDLTNHPAINLRHPGWHIGFDMDGPKAEETRRRILDQAATEGLLVAGYHWPFPALGHVAREGDGYAFVPADWAPAP